MGRGIFPAFTSSSNVFGERFTYAVDQKPVAIAIDEKGQVFLMDQPVEIGQLVEQLKTTAKQGFDERIYVRGSKAVNYGRVAEVMSLVTTAGYKKVALVTEQEKK